MTRATTRQTSAAHDGTADRRLLASWTTERKAGRHLVVGVAHEVEAAHGEDDLLVRLVDVDEVRRARVADLLVGSPLEDALGVDVEVAVLRRRELGAGELVVVVREHGAAEARDGLELVGGRRRPRLAVVGADVGEPLPRPPRAAKAHHPLEPATHRHGRSPRPARARLPRDLGFWCGGGCLRSASGLFSAVCRSPARFPPPPAADGSCGSGLGFGRVVYIKYIFQACFFRNARARRAGVGGRAGLVGARRSLCFFCLAGCAVPAVCAAPQHTRHTCTASATGRSSQLRFPSWCFRTTAVTTHAAGSC